MTKNYCAAQIGDRVYLRSSASCHYLSASHSPSYGGTCTFHNHTRGEVRTVQLTRDDYEALHHIAVVRHSESSDGGHLVPADNWVAATPEVLALLARYY